MPKGAKKCQKVPKGAKKCQKGPKGAKRGLKVPKVPKYVKRSRIFPIDANWCQRVLKGAKWCQKVLKGAKIRFSKNIKNVIIEGAKSVENSTKIIFKCPLQKSNESFYSS